MKDYKRYTITAALPYTNGPIHIGHLAGVYIPADIYARYLRLQNKDVLFVCGSDEHGVPITIKAKSEGVSPQDIVDRYHHMIKKSFEDFAISFDHYGRTTSKTHQETASHFFKTLLDKGKFIEQTTEQLYDKDANQFLPDRFLVGTCPKCGYEEAYGDQCENCGTSLNATDLINPKSAITGNTPSLKSTKHWFLPLDNYQAFLKKWILDEHKDDWKPNVYGQCSSWLNDGLRPRAVTRDLDWGIPVPVENTAGKVLYVWFDAPIGYISATKEWAEEHHKNWKDYWKKEDTKLIHFIGKDNIVFHCIIFPSMLKAEGSFILPDNVPANEFLNLEGKKLSTSKNWAVWLHEYLLQFPYQQDVLRYVLTANAPESKDNDFTWSDFQARNNNELVAIYGNFVNRVVVLTQKYYEGKVPGYYKFLEIDKDILAKIMEFPTYIGASIERYRFREAQQKLMELARLGNKYLAEQEPWKLHKTEPIRTQTIMYVSLQIATALCVLSEPFLPHTKNKLHHILNLKALKNTLKWSDISTTSHLLPVDHTIHKAELLFEKIEDKKVKEQKDKLLKNKMINTVHNQKLLPQKDVVDFEIFSRLDIRTGTILEANKMPKADKLMILKVDVGLDKRTIVSGIAAHYSPEDIIGKKVSVVVNLKPIKLRGTISEGMILMTEDRDGKLVFVNTNTNIQNGIVVA